MGTVSTLQQTHYHLQPQCIPIFPRTEGSETYIRSVTRFVDLEKEDVMSFWDIALRARQLREVAVGYKPAGMNFLEAEELIINPPDKSVERKWNRGDKIITFSMD